MSAPQVIKTAKSRGVYIILGLFIGMLGVHNFYAGYLVRGCIQLLLVLLLGWFVVGFVIVGVWVIVELFVITKDAAGDRLV
jgi:TM2 domain-containing membrane protein YozV